MKRLKKGEKLKAVVHLRTDDLGIHQDKITWIEQSDIEGRCKKSPFVAVFFGSHQLINKFSARNCENLQSIMRDSLTVIPCVDDCDEIEKKIPSCISHINALPLNGENSMSRLASLIMQNMRLLRAERRVFISYKRSDSQTIAIQLYERLDEAGFDVFLDTRSVPYGEDFQGILWHRMADSDIVILLDTKNFRTSRWTKMELAQANATNIQILHLLWPDMPTDGESSFSKFLFLKDNHFHNGVVGGMNSRLSDAAIVDIVAEAESLRARSLASRHLSLVDSFCDKARNSSAKNIIFRPERFISLEMKDGKKIAVIPIVGVPNARNYQEMQDVIRKLDQEDQGIFLLYDDRGILDSWNKHLDWLNAHLPVIAKRSSSDLEWLL